MDNIFVLLADCPRLLLYIDQLITCTKVLICTIGSSSCTAKYCKVGKSWPTTVMRTCSESLLFLRFNFASPDKHDLARNPSQPNALKNKKE
jgi:hypothetical protein